MLQQFSSLHPLTSCTRYSLPSSGREIAIPEKNWEFLKSKSPSWVMIIKDLERSLYIIVEPQISSLLRTPFENMAEEAAPVINEP